MKQSLILGAALCSGTIMAAPRSQKAAPFHSQPQTIKKSSNGAADAVGESYNTQNSIWSGGVLSAASGQTFTGVSGTWTIPTASVPDGASPNTYGGGAWVGIDGTEGYGGLWQAGCGWSIDSTQSPAQTSYFMWYEWFPAGSVVVPVDISPGDQVSVNITAQSPSTGTVVYTNSNSGQSFTTTASAPTSTATLPGLSVEWITEDPTVSTGPQPFANYGSVSYTNCAYDSTTGSGNAAGANLIDMVANGQQLTTTTQPSDTEIDTTYG